MALLPPPDWPYKESMASSIRQAETSGSTVNNPTGKGKGGPPVPARFENNITDGPFRKDKLEYPTDKGKGEDSPTGCTNQ